MDKTIYPFVAIVGQEKLKKAILLNLLNPKIGGVIISGEKGTGKSTIVRSIPTIFSDLNVVDLPLNITEDRLVGSIDLEKAILCGNKELEQGILKKADKNILYIDEVNLLEDSIVNTILQVSSSGLNKIEREGFSYEHSSEFVLIGTMNPEEGNLRSIFLDKFGLFVSVNGELDMDNRKEVVRRRISYEKDPLDFYGSWEEESLDLTVKLKNGINILDQVSISEELLDIIFETLNNCNCEGNRTEIIVVETVKAISALDNRKDVSIDDVKEAFSYVLPHRIKKTEDNEENKEDKEDNQNNKEEDKKFDNEQQNETKTEWESDEDNSNMDSTSSSGDIDVIDSIGKMFKVRNIQFKNKDRKSRKGCGKRNLTKADERKGRYIRYISRNRKIKDIAFDGTLRAAAPYQKFREKHGLAIAIKEDDLREKVREKKVGATIFFLVDASGSISAKKRMEAVKGAIMSLLTDAYEKRDKVCLIAFRKESAEVLLQPTRSVELAKKHLSELPSGGKTPLSLGLMTVYDFINSQWRKDADMIPLLILISDGRANVSMFEEDPLLETFKVGEKFREKDIKSLVIDTESGFLKFGTLKELSNIMEAEYLNIEDLNDKIIYDSIKCLINLE